MPDIDEDIEALLGRRAGTDRASFRAELIDPERPGDRRRLAALLADSETRISDTLTDQLVELVHSRAPAEILSAGEIAVRVGDRLAGPAWAHGIWAYYPWDRRLVHVLRESEHVELRTDRNRHKITAEEQSRLRKLRIGLIGLSAGQSVTTTLAQEGIGGSFRLADFDRLSLSNMNRVRGRLHEIGLPKPIMAARALAEMDPYLEVEVFCGGYGAEVERAFFDGESGPLDFLVEVCDSIDVKALARIHARRRRIPVLMVNSEGGILDIERFDREPDRPLFHGLAPPHIDPAELFGADLDTKVAFLLPIVGLDNLSDRMVASLVEIGSTVSTWPQLASGTALGGALVASAIRRIALGELRESGRHTVALDSLVADGRGERAAVPAAPPAASPPRLERAAAPTDALPALAAAALAAPSGANAQPCRFIIVGDHLEIHRRPAAMIPAFDPDDHSTWIAAGAATENAVLAAAELGLVPSIEIAPVPGEPTAPLVRLVFAPVAAERDPLAAFIERRCTNRKRGDSAPLAPADLALLRASAEERGAALEIVEDAPRRALLADLVGAADRLRLLSHPMLNDLAAELRWTAEEAERTRDGLDVRALELRAGELASLRMMLRAPAMSFLRSIGGGDRIRKMTRDAISGSPALGLLTCEGGAPEVFVRGGRAIERMWLRASERGLAVAPMTTILFLMRLVERSDALLEPGERAEIAELKRAFDEAFPRRPGAVHVFLFRLGRAEPPAVRSLRKRLDDLLEIRK